MAALPGSAMPKASARAFIVEAVPMVLQWPALVVPLVTIFNT
jgi:hypothetical protein